MKQPHIKPVLFQDYRAKYTEQGLLFLVILTLVGGYMNGYSYFTRGGSLVTMQSGNMARIGIAVIAQDWHLLITSIIPILGCLMGCTGFFLAMNIKGRRTPIYWQKFSLIAEILLFAVIGFIPADFFNHTVNFAIAIVSGFQLCNIKSYRGYIHTTTLASGNVRNLGNILADLLLYWEKDNIILFLEYAILFVSFTVGAIIGSIFGKNIGATSIWICCGMLMILLLQMFSQRAREEEQRYLEVYGQEDGLMEIS